MMQMSASIKWAWSALCMLPVSDRISTWSHSHTSGAGVSRVLNSELSSIEIEGIGRVIYLTPDNLE